MNILYHTWEPGLTGTHNTSGGGGTWTSYLFDFFNRWGHNVYWFTSHARPLNMPWHPTTPIDVAVFCWRWKLPDEDRYKERNLAFIRQWQLLNWCVENGVPFLVHDQDLKMLPLERDWVITNGGIIATPSVNPADGEISLHYPNPYHLAGPLASAGPVVYVGNNYERSDQAQRLMVIPRTPHTVEVYGNWLESGPGRESPEQIVEMFPNVNFMGRLEQTKVVEVLNESLATFMLHKPEYGPRGFVTIRWAEAAAAGTVPLIPREFRLPDEYVATFEPVRVGSADDVVRALDRLVREFELRRSLAVALRSFVHKHMTPVRWLRVLERIAKNENV